jgi:UDP-glucose 4-epimerase
MTLSVAVTGGSGFIGSLLARCLAQRGHHVVVVDVREPDSRDGIEFRQADVQEIQQLTPALGGVDTVYHLAGCVVDTMRKSPYDGSKLNLGGTLNMVEAARLRGIRKVLLASSFYVYDGVPPEMVVNEETPLDPKQMELFGASKLMAEALVREYSRTYGFEYVFLRYGSAYGVGDCSNVVKTFLELGLRGEPIEVWGEGKRVNQYTYVEDLAQGSVLALDLSNETLNLISEEETSIGQLARMMHKDYGFNIVFNHVQKEGPSMPYMSSHKAFRQLDWRPISLADGTARMMSALRQAGAERTKMAEGT